MTVLGWICLVWAVVLVVRVLNGIRSGLQIMTRPAVVATLTGKTTQQYTRVILTNIIAGLTSATLLVLAGLALIGVLS